MEEIPGLKPVFVDSSGQRQRRIRRVGVLLAVPVAGYVVLLVSSVLGGPRVDTPLIPLPEAAKQQPAPRVTPAPRESAEPGESIRTTETTVRPVSKVTTSPTPQEQTSTPTQTPSTPTVVPTISSTPTVTPGPPSRTPGHGKPTAPPPGRTKTPGKP